MSNNGYTIHPAADLFPMMTVDELQELAADIEMNGLRFPIIMDADGKILIDGRNRFEACKLANVEPRFAKLPDGSDPLAYIASANLMRRNLTKGQQAMALAMIYPEPEKGGRGKKSAAIKSAVSDGFSATRLKVARSVLHYSRPLAESVLKGITPLDDALAKVKQEQQFQQSDEAKLARLQKAAPDLAEQVKEERLKIDEAIAALQVREAEVRRVCESGRHSAEDIVIFAGHVDSIIAAIDAGEKIAIKPESLKQITNAYSRLTEFAGTTRRG